MLMGPMAASRRLTITYGVGGVLVTVFRRLRSRIVGACQFTLQASRHNAIRYAMSVWRLVPENCPGLRIMHLLVATLSRITHGGTDNTLGHRDIDRPHRANEPTPHQTRLPQRHRPAPASPTLTNAQRAVRRANLAPAMTNAATLFVTVATALLGTAHAQSRNWTLVLVSQLDFPLAANLDGTAPGFYVSPGVGAATSKFIIHIQGGGWCISLGDCYGRSQSTLGSSRQWRSSPQWENGDGGEHGMLSPDAAINPLFHDWTRVFVAYGDGGSWAGSVIAPVASGQGNIYFRGRYNLDAVVSTLKGSYGLAAATEVILKGCSAGGLSVYLHADYVGSLLPAVAKYVAIPGAGFFMDLPGYDGAYHYRGNYQWVAQAMNVTQLGAVNDGCLAFYAGQPGAPLWKCYVAQYTLPFIKTPLFIDNSLADSWQGSEIMVRGPTPPPPPPPPSSPNRVFDGGMPIVIVCHPDACTRHPMLVVIVCVSQNLPCDPANCNASVIAYMDSFNTAMVAAVAPVVTAANGGAFLQTCYRHVVGEEKRGVVVVSHFCSHFLVSNIFI